MVRPNQGYPWTLLLQTRIRCCDGHGSPLSLSTYCRENQKGSDPSYFHTHSERIRAVVEERADEEAMLGAVGLG